ncbi:MAG: class II D-tagatose-bisphosphate aldolase, non-catalytic subunit [Pseudomonadota bacterium]
MTQHPLIALPDARARGEHLGIASVCSAHPIVIEAALDLAKGHDRPVLIEATCNQVNQDGGYSGMTPAQFRAFVMAIANRIGIAADRIILGGDHLGPNPWTHLPADAAMGKAEAMIAAYAEAGFTKLHLDTSMGCAGDPAVLPEGEIAARAARLALVAERHRGDHMPVYIVGTEVPVPGGATHRIERLDVTAPEDAARTYALHRDAFVARGLSDAFSRVIGLVVQPGVEFDHASVLPFEADRARALSGMLRAHPGLVFEAHSTDYQSPEGLKALVANGFSILKVGPWLTFALREALYAADAIADVLDGHAPQGRLMTEMDEIMRADPVHWAGYYGGDGADPWLQRHFSYSDRIRYYWPAPRAHAAVARVRQRLAGREIPAPVMAQFAGVTAARTGDGLLIDAVKAVLRHYEDACRP